MATRKTSLAICVLLAAALTGSGCAGKSKWHFADWRPRAPWSKEAEKPDPKVPARLVATWVDTTLHKQGQTPQRGFGGRIVFFGKETEDPVRVDGQFVVYAFDETDRAPHETQPTRRFIFPKEQFALHEGDSKLGASYSVWLPWDDVGGPMKKISLIARFEPEDGPVVMGEQTRHLLPGVNLPSQQLAGVTTPTQAVAPQGVTLASHSEHSVMNVSSGPLPSAGRAGEGGSAQVSAQPPSAIAPSAPLSQMSTMTIRLPRPLGATQASPQRAAGFIPAVRRAPTRFDQSENGEVAAATGRPTTDVATQSAAAPTAPPQAQAHQAPTPPRPQTQSLRNSLLSTLPARVVPAAQPAPAGAR